MNWALYTTMGFYHNQIYFDISDNFEASSFDN